MVIVAHIFMPLEGNDTMTLLIDTDTYPKSVHWQEHAHVPRAFVRYADHRSTAVKLARYVPFEPDAIALSVIIPTSDAYRDGYFPRLLQQIYSQNMRSFELIIICGDPRQGRAINMGAAMAQGKYLLTLDDDTSLPDREIFAKLTAAMENNPDIGMAGGNNVIPENATPFVRKVMEQVPRRSWEPVSRITDSDLAEHPCLIMRAEAFRAVGGENELLPRGLDPYLRQAFREAGWRVVVIPGVIYHHLPPDAWNKLLKQFFRNGRQAAFVNRRFPQWVIETPGEHGSFRLRIPLFQRLLRFPMRLLGALSTGKPVLFFCEAAYALGFAAEWLSGRSPQPTSRLLSDNAR